MTEPTGETSEIAKHQNTDTPDEQSAFPTETEIYILPDGRVVVADLPAELSALVAQIGASLEEPLSAEKSHDQPN